MDKQSYSVHVRDDILSLSKIAAKKPPLSLMDKEFIRLMMDSAQCRFIDVTEGQAHD